MKFVCEDCHRNMEFVSNDTNPDTGVMVIRYTCSNCGRRISMVTNPGETQLVSSLGVTIGHEALAEAEPEPMRMVRRSLDPDGSWSDSPSAPDPVWTEAAQKRLAAAPAFVQGMVRRLYTDWAKQHGYAEITPAVMNAARDALGMTGM